MPRPRKCRRVCGMPKCRRFGPLGQTAGTRKTITMTVDEFEVIRLIDLDGLTQEECARQMTVARTTAQAIYASARAKLAEYLVNGAVLSISGGDYILCERKNGECGQRHCCQRHRPPAEDQENGAAPGRALQEQKEGATMKIAVTYENGQVFQHFGSASQFKLYEIAQGKIVSSSVIGTDGKGHGALADFLKSRDVDTLICGGIGEGAKHMLSEAGISLYGGVTGDADAAANAFLNGSLSFQPQISCDHHEGQHDGGDSCETCGH